MKTAEPSTRRRTRRHALVRVAQITILVAATWFLAAPQFPKAWAALGDLRTAQPGLVLLSAAAALLALVTYAQLMRTTLADGVRPGFWHTMGIIITSLGVSNVVPAGSAAGSVVTFRMLERAGVARARAMTAMAVTSIGSALVLSVLLWIGLLTLLPTHGVASGALAAIPATGLLVLLAVVAHATSARSPALWAMG
ncbi:MAG: lysylphosphatidylglycerol synthase domain-containing protein, partial [Acidimicrobiales bacterium]